MDRPLRDLEVKEKNKGLCAGNERCRSQHHIQNVMIKMMIEILKGQIGTILLISGLIIILAGWMEFDLSKDPIRCPILSRRIFIDIIEPREAGIITISFGLILLITGIGCFIRIKKRIINKNHDEENSE